MAFPLVGALVSLGVGAGGKYVSKALGHGQRVKRKHGEQEIAKTESDKGFGQVSYECIRRVDASISVGSSHPLYLNFGKAGGKTDVGDEIACFHAAQDLGAQFTGREFDDASGQLLSVTHPEFYAQNNGAVPGNTGSPIARGAGAGIQDAAQKDSAAMEVYSGNHQLVNPADATSEPAAQSVLGGNTGLITLGLGILAIVLILFGRGHRG